MLFLTGNENIIEAINVGYSLCIQHWSSEKADWREMSCSEKYSDLRQCQQDLQRLENVWFASFCFLLNVTWSLWLRAKLSSVLLTKVFSFLDAHAGLCAIFLELTLRAYEMRHNFCKIFSDLVMVLNQCCAKQNHSVGSYGYCIPDSTVLKAGFWLKRHISLIW